MKLLVFALLIAVAPALPGAALAQATSNFNAQDPCRAEVSKFEQAIGYIGRRKATRPRRN